VGHGIAHAPAGHGEALGKAVDDGDAVRVLLPPDDDARRLVGLVDELVVDFIGDDEQAAIQRPFHDGVAFGHGITGARGVGRRVEDEYFGLRGQCGFELFHRHFEALRGRGLDRDRHAAVQVDHVGIAHPVRRGDEHFVAVIEQGGEQVVQGLLAAIAGDGTVRRDVDAVRALKVTGDGFPQGRDAGHGGVAGKALVDSLFRGVADMGGGGEIRFADCQAGHVDALRFELEGLGVDGQGGGRLYVGHSFGELHGTIPRWLHDFVVMQ